MNATSELRIPTNLLPGDGRFGSGPSKVRADALNALCASGSTILGTSHRKAPIKKLVEQLRNGLREMYGLPDDYEVVVANGGATYFWDAMTFSVIRQQSQHVCYGEFSAKFARHVQGAPFLSEPEILRADYGKSTQSIGRKAVDVYAQIQNETSTGVAAAIRRPDGADEGALVVVDATSSAGGMVVEHQQYDCFYFSPQKCLASDGGMWLAFFSPRAIARVAELEAGDRWIPETMRLQTALDNSRLNQTYNTLAIATVFLALTQVEWINARGGIDWAAARCRTSSQLIYEWAQHSDYATPFVVQEDERSPVVATIDLDDAIDAKRIVEVLAANGIVDTGAYGKLDRNQLRIATYPAIEPEDIAALLQCIDYVVQRMA